MTICPDMIVVKDKLVPFCWLFGGPRKCGKCLIAHKEYEEILKKQKELKKRTEGK